MSWDRRYTSTAIIISTLLITVPFLGMSHLFDWDEVNFAEAAREMLVTGEYSYVQINFKPFWEKPPLFIWMQAVGMSIFGVNEFAARLPNAVCSALTLGLLFNIGSNLKSEKFGLLWVLVYAGSLLPQFYFRSGIIDPCFNLLIFLGIHQLIQASLTQKMRTKYLSFSAVFIGLAVLTKGPTAIGIIGICSAIYFATNFKQHQWRLTDFAVYISLVVVVGFSWYLIELMRGHGHVVQEAIDYHIRLLSQSEAGHGQPFYYHPLVLLIGCFPMSLFFIFSWSDRSAQSDNVAHYAKWMSILFWVVLIVFSIVKTKIIHYSSLTYFPMSFLAAVSIQNLMDGKWKFKVVHQLTFLFFIVILGSVFVLSGMIETIKEPLLELVKNDGLAFGNFSQTGPDGVFDPWIGVLFMVLSMISVVFLLIGKTEKGTVGLFGTSLVTVVLLSIFIAPKIDRYTQSSLFNFYEKSGSDAYYEPIGFHSYAHLFYGKREPLPLVTDDEPKWLLFEKVDKPTYFISRAQDLKSTLNYFPHLKETSRKGGYVVLERTDENYPFLGEP